jgi:hypothetical protein
MHCQFIPDCCVPERKFMDVPYLGRGVPWMMRPLDDAFLYRCVPLSLRPLIDASLVNASHGRCVLDRSVPTLWVRLTLCWDKLGRTVEAKPGIHYTALCARFLKRPLIYFQEHFSSLVTPVPSIKKNLVTYLKNICA